MQGALYLKRCEGQHWEMLHKEHSEHVNNTLPKYVVCQGSTARSSQTSGQCQLDLRIHIASRKNLTQVSGRLL